MHSGVIFTNFYLSEILLHMAGPFASACPQSEPRLGARNQLEVLLAEDNPGDVFLVKEALECHQLDALLTVRVDGEEMLSFIDQIDSGQVGCPDIVLLDLNLPKHSGETLLRRMRQSPVLTRVPVVIVTSSDSPRDRETAARLGASSYFRKPHDFDEFLKLGGIVKSIVGQGRIS